MILPSTFRDRIIVKVPITLQDAAGGIGTSGYSEQYTTWGSVESIEASRLTYYGIDLFQNGWIIKLRYNVDRIVTTGTVIEFDGRELIVRSTQVSRNPYKRFLLLICQESVTT